MDEFTRRLGIRLFCIGLKKAVRDLIRINVCRLRLKRPDLTSEVPRISDGDCWWQVEVFDWILISHKSRDWLNDLKQREILCKLMTEIPRMAGCNGGLQIEFLFWLNRSFRSQDRMGYCRLRSCLDWWLRYHGWQDVMDDYRWKSCFDWWSLMEVGNEWMIEDCERSFSVGWLRVPWMAGCNGWLRMEFLFDWGGHSTRELDFPEELINFRHRSWTSRKNWWTSGTGVGLPGRIDELPVQELDFPEVWLREWDLISKFFVWSTDNTGLKIWMCHFFHSFRRFYLRDSYCWLSFRESDGLLRYGSRTSRKFEVNFWFNRWVSLDIFGSFGKIG